MNNTMPNVKTSKPITIVNRHLLIDAQRKIKENPQSWPWKLCMHKAKQAYGIECDEPLPEVGDRNGNYICTYVNVEHGEYAFTHQRIVNKRGIKQCCADFKGFMYVAS